MKNPVSIEEMLLAPSQVWDLMPQTISDVTAADAVYHSEMREKWIDANQMQSERNVQAHSQAIALLLEGVDQQSVCLELGCGVGFDANLAVTQFPEMKAYLLSEIDEGLAHYAKESNPALAQNNSVIACCLDGNELLLKPSQVDRILCVATLHHFPNLAQSLSEFNRVSRPGARLVFAIEPNRFWLQGIAFCRPIYRKLFRKKSNSAADEKAEGFTWKELNTLGSQQGWITEQVIPVWFFAGFLHYSLEVCYRLLRLKNRIHFPRSLERFILQMDRLLFRVPGMSLLAWHYTTVYRK